MTPSLHKLFIYRIAFLVFILYEAESCNAQQIIKLHDEIRRTNYYRYLSAKGETTLLLNSKEGNELDLFMKFSPETSFPMYLVLFCYELKVAEPGSKAIILFTDGTSIELRNTGKLNYSSMFLFDITSHKTKLSLTEVEKINVIDKSGHVSDDYYFNEHSGYFINFYNLYVKMKAGYNAIAASDTIQ